MTSSIPVATVLGIAIRPAAHGPMIEMQEATVVEQGGIDGDKRARPARGVTFLSYPQWRDICRALGAALPWHTRRANVLVDAPSLMPLINQVITIGQVRIKVLAETQPCHRMDEIHPGLQRVLREEARGGVYGLVLQGGRIAVTDDVRLAADDQN